MPPYGLYSLADTPEELLSEGYNNNYGISYDPAFGELQYTERYQPGPYTGERPFQNIYDITSGIKSPYGFFGDLRNPSFGGSGNPRFNQFEPEDVATGIMQQAPGFFDDNYGQIFDSIDAEKEDYLPGQKPSGIARLFEFLKNLPTPFNLARRGLESLRGANQRLQQSDFGQSRTGAEYFMKRRERKQAERAQEEMSDVYRSARDQGFTNDRGGFSTNRADRAGTSLGSGQFNSKRSTGRQGY